jgi:hypothetical protein
MTYIPETRQVKQDYAWAGYPSQSVARAEAFDRWLAKHDIELAEQLGWKPLGSHIDYDGPLEFAGVGEDGLPVWERKVS